jgi:hypothetical protein
MSNSDETTYNNPQFKPFQSGNSLCHPSKDYTNLKGGNKTLISTQPGKNMYKTQNFKVDTNLLKKTTMGKSYATSAGGSKKSTKMKKGGEVIGEESQSTTNNYSGGKSKKSTKMKKGGEVIGEESQSTTNNYSGGKSKKITKMKKGGVTGMPSQFYNSKPVKGAPVNSGHINGVESLATQALSSLTNNDNTGVQAGGKSNKSKKMKKGGDVSGFETQYTKSLSSIDKASVQSGGKSNKSKKMKKGGVTGMPSQFYDGKPIDGVSSNNGNGVKTPYGIIEPLDAGVGNLAPYNTSKNSSKLSMTKTGGNKKKGGGDNKLIPRLSDSPFKTVNNIVNTGARTIQKFFKEYKIAYNKSLVKIQNTKNGMSRLSQGGTKKKNILKGGSDWGSTLNSRGPSNAPDTSEAEFRIFNKTGEYIPNSKLAKAAAPILTGGPKVDKVKSFDPTESSFKSLNGGKSKSTKASSKSSSKSTKTSAKSTTKNNK